MSELNELGERTRSSVPILIAEDSPLLNKLIVDSLKAAGYVNLIHTENGQKAYDVITQCKEDEMCIRDSSRTDCTSPVLSHPVPCPSDSGNRSDNLRHSKDVYKRQY